MLLSSSYDKRCSSGLRRGRGWRRELVAARSRLAPLLLREPKPPIGRYVHAATPSSMDPGSAAPPPTAKDSHFPPSPLIPVTIRPTFLLRGVAHPRPPGSRGHASTHLAHRPWRMSGSQRERS